MSLVKANFMGAINTLRTLIPAEVGKFTDIVSLVLSSQSDVAGTVRLFDGTATYQFTLSPFGSISYTPILPLPASSLDTDWTVLFTAPGGEADCVVTWIDRL